MEFVLLIVDVMDVMDAIVTVISIATLTSHEITLKNEDKYILIDYSLTMSERLYESV